MSMKMLTELALNAKGYLQGMSQSQGALSQFKRGLGALGPAGKAATAAVGVGFVGLSAAIYGTKKAIDEAAETEFFEVQFRNLLGSVEAARDRMAELREMNRKSPFELNDFVRASALLQRFTGDALGAGEGLRLVADTASLTNGRDLQNTAMWIGRLFDAIKNGRPVGEPLQQLAELGAFGGEIRTQLEAMQASGAGAVQMWAAVERELKNNEGASEQLARTWIGKMSDLSDSWSNVKREFGEPIMNSLKPWLDGGISMINSLTDEAKAAGATIADYLDDLRALFQGGGLGAVGLKLKTDLLDAANFMVAHLRAGLAGMGAVIGPIFDEVLSKLGKLGTSQFWEGLKRQMETVMLAFQEVMGVTLRQLGSGMYSIPGMEGFGSRMQAQGLNLIVDARKKLSDNRRNPVQAPDMGLNLLTPEQMGEDYKQAVKKSLKDVKPLFNTSEAREELAKMSGPRLRPDGFPVTGGFDRPDMAAINRRIGNGPEAKWGEDVAKNTRESRDTQNKMLGVLKDIARTLTQPQPASFAP